MTTPPEVDLPESLHDVFAALALVGLMSRITGGDLVRIACSANPVDELRTTATVAYLAADAMMIVRDAHK